MQPALSYSVGCPNCGLCVAGAWLGLRLQRLLRVATVRVDFKRLWNPLSKIQIDGMSHQPNKQLLNIYYQRHCVGCMTSHKVDLRLK